ncbi:hypothetical protein GCM10025771_06370 [Niveibacterium umoris]|uniref:STAS/SEC14 domain-containing protein n=1 Tax=Niveibacterium umoris TaxID=1193620 RepID=A0A840BSL5_9RHOO|nr:hypothetical protein [Niveibacterium umoris]MBB4013816.1 hypothetical protein [Niveibacterium umoris]
MEWTQHGSYALHWQGDILVARYEGAWNDVAAKHLHRDARILWQLRGPAAWGLLSDARDWTGATPEALEAWWAFFEDGVAHGLIAASDVHASMFNSVMVSPLAERAMRLAHYRSSRSVDDALAWLAQLGLKTAPDPSKAP